jgi:hypothetical protein
VRGVTVVGMFKATVEYAPPEQPLWSMLRQSNYAPLEQLRGDKVALG